MLQYIIRYNIHTHRFPWQSNIMGLSSEVTLWSEDQDVGSAVINSQHKEDCN